MQTSIIRNEEDGSNDDQSRNKEQDMDDATLARHSLNVKCNSNCKKKGWWREEVRKKEKLNEDLAESSN